MLRLLCFIFLMIGLSGCASSSFEVLDINALSSDRDDNGSFKGLERLAQRSPDNNKKIRVNIIYLLGIGYVENPEGAPLANAFIRASPMLIIMKSRRNPSPANADGTMKTKIFACLTPSVSRTPRSEIIARPSPALQSNLRTLPVWTAKFWRLATILNM